MEDNMAILKNGHLDKTMVYPQCLKIDTSMQLLRLWLNEPVCDHVPK